MKSPRPSAIAACAACLAPALPCSAQGVIQSEFVRSYGRLEYTNGGHTHAHLGAVIFDDALDHTHFMSDGLTDDGFQAGMSSYFDLAFNPSDPGPGGPFAGFELTLGAVNNILAANPVHSNEDSTTRTSAEFRFTLDAPMLWDFDALVAGSAAADGVKTCRAWFDFVLSDTLSGQIIAERHFLAKADGAFDEAIDLTGTLEPGDYTFLANTAALLNNQSQSGTGNARAEVLSSRFSLNPIPGPASAIPLTAMLAWRRRRVSIPR